MGGDLEGALDRVNVPSYVIDEHGIIRWVNPAAEEPPRAPHPDLTPRQSEVLRLLEHGRTTDQIAERLHLSPETVRNHIRAVLRALDVHSRLEAVAVARRDHLAAI